MHFSMIVFLSPKVRNSYSVEYLLVTLFRKCSIELVYDCYLGWRVVKCAGFFGFFFNVSCFSKRLGKSLANNLFTSILN